MNWWGEKHSVFTMKHDVSCGFLVGTIYQVEEVPFHSRFVEHSPLSFIHLNSPSNSGQNLDSSLPLFTHIQSISKSFNNISRISFKIYAESNDFLPSPLVSPNPSYHHLLSELLQ